MENKAWKVNPSIDFYRFGGMAVARNYVTLDQVQAALVEQVEDDVMGRPHRLLGDILVAYDWMTQEQMESIMEELDSLRV